MSRIEAVISDFGGVLTSPLLGAFASVQESEGITFEQLGRAMVAITARAGENPLYVLERGQMTEPAFITQVAEELTAQLQRPVHLHRFGERYFQHLNSNDEMIDYMRTLRERGYKLAICTNNVREWEQRWRRMLPVDEIFDVVVDSAFVGTRKPEPEIYRITLERLAVDAEAAVFVDDVQVNCDGATAVGITAVWFQSTEQAIAEIESAL